MVTCQLANQLKTPAKVSWAFKMVSQFGSLGYTIMGKTADLTVVQKTIIDILHKEDKTQTFITKEAVCSQSAVSKHVNRKLSGRKKCGRKRCTTNRENRSLMRIVKHLIQDFGWTSQGMDWGWGQGIKSTTHRRVKKFGYSCRQRRLTWAKEKKNWTVAQWTKVLFSDESKFCISFGNHGPRVWRKSGEAQCPSCLKSSVKFPQSVMIWGAMSSAGVGSLCFLKTNVTAQFTKTFWSTSCFLLLASFLKMLIENLRGIVKRKMRNKRPKNADELKATVKETWASIPPQQCHKLITSTPRRIEAVIKAKGAPTKYWVHIQ